MRYCFFILIFLIVMGCKSKLDLSSGQVITLNGNLDSKFPISMWILEKHDIIYGQVKYVKTSNKPIRLIGNPYKENIELVEYLEDGTICGIWKGKLENNGYNGNWYSSDGNKEYKFDLIRQDSIIKNIDTTIVTNDYKGFYKYKHGTDGPQGEIRIKKRNGYYSLSCVDVTSAPSRNIANFEIDTLKIVNNETICDLNKDGHCVFKINYFNDFLIISSIDGKRDCRFGLNAYVDGTYIKIK